MTRFEYWAGLINDVGAAEVVEVGVHRGDWSEHMLRETDCTVTLVDPWRVLPEWNKPMNTSDADLEASFAACLARMYEFDDRVVVRRETSLEASRSVSMTDVVYLDGDHTLRGIVLDCLSWWPLLRNGGLLGGDDCSLGGQHASFEPTMVWPFVRFFAEAVDCPLEVVGGQWLIRKNRGGFSVSGDAVDWDMGVRECIV